jgi:Spy/CpxP family protein refolding chaperone
MKKYILLAMSLILALGMLVAQPVMKHNPNAIPGPKVNDNPNLKARLTDDGTGMGRWADLDLSDKQKAKLEELRTEFQKRTNLAEAEIENLHLDIETALKNDNYAKAKELTNQVFNKKAALAVARIDHMQAVMKELNKEQQEKARDMFMMQHRGNMMMKGMRGMGMHQGMGPGMGMHQGMGQGMQMGMHQGMQNGCPDCDDCQNMGPSANAPKTETPK